MFAKVNENGIKMNLNQTQQKSFDIGENGKNQHQSIDTIQNETSDSMIIGVIEIDSSDEDVTIENLLNEEQENEAQSRPALRNDENNETTEIDEIHFNINKVQTIHMNDFNDVAANDDDEETFFLLTS